MLFEIANRLTLFLNIINKIFKYMLDLGIITYIDNRHIYSQTKEKHEKLIKEVLSHLQKYNLSALIDKYKFYKYKITFLSYMISDIRINIA
jgi:DNA-binding transcriptional regulator YhcF (GntR family)